MSVIILKIVSTVPGRPSDKVRQVSRKRSPSAVADPDGVGGELGER